MGVEGGGRVGVAGCDGSVFACSALLLLLLPPPLLFTRLRLLQVSVVFQEAKKEPTHMQLDSPLFRGWKRVGVCCLTFCHMENHTAGIIAACGVSPSPKLPADKTLQPGEA